MSITPLPKNRLKIPGLSDIPAMYYKIGEIIKFIVDSVIPSLDYTEYEILVSQSSTDAPAIVSINSTTGVAGPFINTLSGTPVLSRDAEGYYLITLAGAFPQGKTTCEIQKQGLLATNVISKSEEAIRWVDANSIAILTTDGTGGALSGGTDGILNYHLVRIRVRR